MEFVRGTKLSLLPPDEIRRLVKIGQDAFLVQLLEIGFFHSDPHPGNLLKVLTLHSINDLPAVSSGMSSQTQMPQWRAGLPQLSASLLRISHSRNNF